MLHSHTQHSEFVELAGHRVTCGNHGRQLVDQVIHLVPPPFLDLAVRFPMDRSFMIMQDQYKWVTQTVILDPVSSIHF